MLRPGVCGYPGAGEDIGVGAAKSEAGLGSCCLPSPSPSISGESFWLCICGRDRVGVRAGRRASGVGRFLSFAVDVGVLGESVSSRLWTELRMLVGV